MRKPKSVILLTFYVYLSDGQLNEVVTDAVVSH